MNNKFYINVHKENMTKFVNNEKNMQWIRSWSHFIFSLLFISYMANLWNGEKGYQPTTITINFENSKNKWQNLNGEWKKCPLLAFNCRKSKKKKRMFPRLIKNYVAYKRLNILHHTKAKEIKILYFENKKEIN